MDAYLETKNPTKGETFIMEVFSRLSTVLKQFKEKTCSM